MSIFRKSPKILFIYNSFVAYSENQICVNSHGHIQTYREFSLKQGNLLDFADYDKLTLSHKIL